MPDRMEKDIAKVSEQNEKGTEAFFPMLAHEVYRLSEIINVSLGNIQKHSISQDPELDLSRRTAARLYYLAELALMASRSNQNPIKLSPLRFDIRKSLTDVIEGLGVAYPEAKTRIIVSDSSLGFIEADPVLVEFALSNVLENALKYGTGEIKVSVAEANLLKNSTMLIQIENLSRADFLQEEEERSGMTRISWGIGLSLIRQIAEAHGGSFVFDNEGPSVTVSGDNFRKIAAKIYLPVAITS